MNEPPFSTADLLCLKLDPDRQTRYLRHALNLVVRHRMSLHGLPSVGKWEEFRTIKSETLLQITVSSPEDGPSLEQVFSRDGIKRVASRGSRGPSFRLPILAMKPDRGLIQVLIRIQMDLGWSAHWASRGFQPAIDMEAGTLTCRDRSGSKSVLCQPLQYANVPRKRILTRTKEVEVDGNWVVRRELVFSLSDLYEMNRLGSWKVYAAEREKEVLRRLKQKYPEV